MTHQESPEARPPGPNAPPTGEGSEPTAQIPDPSTPDPEATTPIQVPDAVAAEPLPRASRRARLGARWRTSLALRVATAVVVALLIGAIGFAAGTAVTDGGHHRARHEVSANHPFWQDHDGWIHRRERGVPHRPMLPPAAPPAAPSAPAPTN